MSKISHGLFYCSLVNRGDINNTNVVKIEQDETHIILHKKIHIANSYRW